MKTTIVYRGYIGIMENEMETTIVYTLHKRRAKFEQFGIAVPATEEGHARISRLDLQNR